MGLIYRLLANDRLYFGLLLLEILLFSWLNAENEMMQGIMPYYDSFSAYFSGGFSGSHNFFQGSATFPMWGYGGVPLLFGDAYWPVVLLQQGLALFAVYRLDALLKELAVKPNSRWLFRLFTLLGICWWLFGSVLWPYSLAASLLVLSLVYLLTGYHRLDGRWIILAAVMMGLLLNFRSDYLYLAIVISLMIGIYFYGLNRRLFLAALAYPIIVVLLLLPWGVHSKAWSGSFSLTSSNSGHVFYLSLGQLPNNPWDITPLDDDASMRQLVQERTGKVSTLTPQATGVLMEAWKENVRNHPGAYLRKVAWSGQQLIFRPFSTGQIFRRFYADEAEANERKSALKSSIRSANLGSLFNQVSTPANWGFLLDVGIGILNSLLFLSFLLALFMVFVRKGWRLFKDFGLLLITLVITYQLTLLLLVFYNGNYNTNIYLLYALVAGLAYGGQSHFVPVSEKIHQ